jgi:hypothetical protein
MEGEACEPAGCSDKVHAVIGPADGIVIKSGVQQMLSGLKPQLRLK